MGQPPEMIVSIADSLPMHCRLSGIRFLKLSVAKYGAGLVPVCADFRVMCESPQMTGRYDVFPLNGCYGLDWKK
jgi:hypothetical protein